MLQRLPEEIKIKHEKLKEEMIGIVATNVVYSCVYMQWRRKGAN